MSKEDKIRFYSSFRLYDGVSEQRKNRIYACCVVSYTYVGLELLRKSSCKSAEVVINDMRKYRRSESWMTKQTEKQELSEVMIALLLEKLGLEKIIA